MSADALDERERAAYRFHAELCKTLTDPKRLMIMQALKDGRERSVGQLADMVGMTLPNASQHLAVLRYAGLVGGRRQATTVYYSLTEPRIAEACEIVHQIALDRMPRAGLAGALRDGAVVVPRSGEAVA